MSKFYFINVPLTMKEVCYPLVFCYNSKNYSLIMQFVHITWLCRDGTLELITIGKQTLEIWQPTSSQLGVFQTRSCPKKQIPKIGINKNMVWNVNKKQVVSISPTSERKLDCQFQVPNGFLFSNHLLRKLLENSDYIKMVLCDQRL